MPNMQTIAFRSLDDGALDATPGDRRRASRPLFGARDAARRSVHSEVGDDAPLMPPGAKLEQFIRAYDEQRRAAGQRIAGSATVVAAARLRGYTSQRRFTERMIREAAARTRET